MRGKAPIPFALAWAAALAVAALPGLIFDVPLEAVPQVCAVSTVAGVAVMALLSHRLPEGPHELLLTVISTWGVSLLAILASSGWVHLG